MKRSNDYSSEEDEWADRVLNRNKNILLEMASKRQESLIEHLLNKVNIDDWKFAILLAEGILDD